ncbi:MAG: helix-turn-helix domain-containing protein [Armatimonadota bacterium]
MSGFSASRLTIARQFRRLTKRDLASLVGVSAPMITHYESGAIEPPEEVINSLVFRLQFLPSFFYKAEIDAIPQKAVSFRSARSITATVRERMLACGKIASGVLSPHFRHCFRLPSPDVPDLSHEGPELAAEVLRRHWKQGFGPIPNMVHLLELKGVDVYWTREQSDALDALSFWRDGQPYVLMNAAKACGVRGRFDAAHELGHLVLHRSSPVLQSREIEQEAHRFASAFLLPADQFRQECASHVVFSQFLELKKRWGVSVQALVRRAFDLEIISEWQYKSACIEISRRGWRTKEPEDDAFSAEESRLHEQIFSRLSDRGMSPREIADQVHMRHSDLAELAPQIRVAEKQPPVNVSPFLRQGYAL